MIRLHEEKTNFFKALLEIGCLLFKDGVCIVSQHVKLQSKKVKTVEIRTKLVQVNLFNFLDYCQITQLFKIFEDFYH